MLADHDRATAAIDVPPKDLDAHYATPYGIFASAPRHLAAPRFDARRARCVAKERRHRD